MLALSAVDRFRLQVLIRNREHAIATTVLALTRLVWLIVVTSTFHGDKSQDGKSVQSLNAANLDRHGRRSDRIGSAAAPLARINQIFFNKTPPKTKIRLSNPGESVR
jgi:hypothetical protein